MKKLPLLIFGAAMLVFGACANKEKANEAVTIPEVDVEEHIEAVTNANAAVCDTVIEVTDAATLAPGVKVDRLTVVDFNAVWCGPCRQLAPVFADMAKKYAGKVDFYSVDVDKFGKLMQDYNLGNSIPVVLFLKPEGTSEFKVGTSELLPAEKLESLIVKNL